MNTINEIISKYRWKALRLHVLHQNPRPGHKRPPAGAASYYLSATATLERIFHESD